MAGERCNVLMWLVVVWFKLCLEELYLWLAGNLFGKGHESLYSGMFQKINVRGVLKLGACGVIQVMFRRITYGLQGKGTR